MTSVAEDRPTSMPATDQDSLDPIEKLTKRDIVVNVAIISSGFLLNFTAFHATANLQTSLYPLDGSGNRILIALNLAAFVSNLLLTMPVNGRLGLKGSLLLCLFTHTSLPAANLYPIEPVLYSGAVVTGLGAGPLWSAKSTYLTLLGQRYAELSGGGSEACVARFFGIFFTVYYGSSVVGNVVSSVVLRMPHLGASLSGDAVEDLCGANFCYGKVSDDGFSNWTLGDSDPAFFGQPSADKVVTLFGILSVCSVLSCPLVALLTSLKTSQPGEREGPWKSLLTLLRQMGKMEEILLMPLALYSGVIYSFITADFCVGYITCTVGIDDVGFVMSAFGASAGLGAIFFGQLLKYTGRQAIFAFGALLNLGVLVAFLKYPPSSDSSLALYAFAGLWGVATVIWTSQYLAFIGYVFRDGNKEAAFACNYSWQMIGTFSWHASSTFMCIRLQIFVMMVILTIGLVGYCILEVKLFRESKNLEKPKDDRPKQ